MCNLFVDPKPHMVWLSTCYVDVELETYMSETTRRRSEPFRLFSLLDDRSSCKVLSDIALGCVWVCSRPAVLSTLLWFLLRTPPDSCCDLERYVFPNCEAFLLGNRYLFRLSSSSFPVSRHLKSILIRTQTLFQTLFASSVHVSRRPKGIFFRKQLSFQIHVPFPVSRHPKGCFFIRKQISSQTPQSRSLSRGS